MKTQNLSLIRRLLFGIIFLPSLSSAWQPGTYPAPPQRMSSSGFSVNRADRNDVVAFWHAVYQASEGYENRVGWSGNFSGDNGTTSTAFRDDVERRLNYFRAMCGVSGDVGVNRNNPVVIDPNDRFVPAASTLKSAASQNAALMIARNYNPSNGNNPALSHDPPRNVEGWSSSAWNAAAKGSFAFGLYGPGAITEYMIERISSSAVTSAWNTDVGHRRWNLFPDATNFATGDQPGRGVNVPPTNVLYVIQSPSEISENPGPDFVAYPAAGFFPVGINTPFWSLSAKGADFSNATVRMTDAAGNPVPIIAVRRNNAYGDPAIIWEVGGNAAARFVLADTRFDVFVSGIQGKVQVSDYNYSVTLINPNLIMDDQSIVGDESISASQGGAYRFTPPVGAEAVRVVAAKRESKKLRFSAESASTVIDETAPNYSLRVKSREFAGYAKLKGKQSYRLTFPNAYDPIRRGVLEQSFQLGRDIIAKPGAKLSFRYRRGFMTKTSALEVQASTNGGVSWQRLGNPIKGVSDNTLQGKVLKAERSLPQSSTPIRIRFHYYREGGAIYTHEAAPTSPTGIFIDEIRTKNCDWLDVKRENVLSNETRNFDFNSGTAGSSIVPNQLWSLRLQTLLGGVWQPHGPERVVRVAAP
ncbi:MAG: hypothetical protein HC845_09980 [Akkermansiaceae bacterium]|nr:hypothetical protein [Akkermansiaceae bacterium]